MKTPNGVHEDLSMIQRACSGPDIPDTDGRDCWSPGNPFDNVVSSFYWSATCRRDPSEVWSVRLDSGEAGRFVKSDDALGVAVRGGPRPSP